MQKSKKIKIVFIGTPDFGLPALKSLIADKNFEVLGVITQKDKKVGRKQILQAPPIKKEALAHKIPVFQTDNIKKFDFPFKNLDFIVVIAFGQIIPKKILDLPKYACINVHGSLLPKYRGASCVQAPILNRDKYTGISIMKMDTGLDTGPIIYQEKIKIKEKETAGELYDRLSNLAGKILNKTLILYSQGKLKEKKQDNGKASYVGLLKKQDGKINLNQSAKNIEAFIRAMNPWPGAFLSLRNKNIKIIETGKISSAKNKKTLFSKNNKLFLSAKDGSIEIKKLQIAGKNIMSARDFINGYKNSLQHTI